MSHRLTVLPGVGVPCAGVPCVATATPRGTAGSEVGVPESAPEHARGSEVGVPESPRKSIKPGASCVPEAGVPFDASAKPPGTAVPPGTAAPSAAVRFRNASADCRRTLQFAAPRRCAFFFNAATVPRLLSTSTALRAPRESASNPSAPLPANRSRQSLPSTCPASQLNNVSRTRPRDGRTAALAGTFSFRPFHRPPIMRTSFLDMRTFVFTVRETGRHTRTLEPC